MATVSTHRAIPTVAQLRLTRPAVDDDTAHLKGYRTQNDGGEGTWSWASASTETDDGGSILAVQGVTTGRWKRNIPHSGLSPRHFGAYGDNADGAGHDDTVAVQKCFNAAQLLNCKVAVTPGDYQINDTILLNNWFGMIVEGDFVGTGQSPNEDKCVFSWNVAAQWTGTNAAISAISIDGTSLVGTATLSGLTGASFTSDDINKFISIAPAGGFLSVQRGSDPNRGAYLISNVFSGTSVQIQWNAEPTDTLVAAASGILWYYAIKPMFDIRGRDCVFRNFVITVNNNKHLYCGINATTSDSFLYRAVKLENVVITSQGVTNKHLIHCFIWGDKPNLMAGFPVQGEDLILERCGFISPDAFGVYIPNETFQAKHIGYDDCRFAGGRIGVWSYYSGFSMQRPSFYDHKDAGLYYSPTGAGLDSCSIYDGTSEDEARLIACTNLFAGGTNGLQMIGGRYAANQLHADGGYIRCFGNGCLTMTGVYFDALPSGSIFNIAMYNTTIPGVSQGGSVVAIGCTFPVATPIFDPGPGHNVGYTKTIIGCNWSDTVMTYGLPIPNEIAVKYGDTVNETINGSMGWMNCVERLTKKRSTSVNSGSTLTLARDGLLNPVAGTTDINYITTTDWSTFGEAVLEMTNAAGCTIKHGVAGAPGSTAKILLNGDADFVGRQGSKIALCWDATNWVESWRKY